MGYSSIPRERIADGIARVRAEIDRLCPAARMGAGEALPA
jgi:hypothetical protein